MRFNNPSITFKTKIPDGLKPGTTVYFRGTVRDNANRFHINLLAPHNIAMHYNPRFRGWSGVVFNTRRGRGWQREERAGQKFEKGAGFELLFTVTPEGYQVDVNGEPHYLFKHRMPVEHVEALQVAGHVSMETIIIGEKDIEKTLSIPYECIVDGGLQTGMTVLIKGRVHNDIHRFHINFQCGDGQRCDKALHFNPRFRPSEVVVFNTFRNGRWEREERPDGMPFTRGGDFEMAIVVTAEGYQINVNNQEFYLFMHRLPVEHVSGIKIAGDVSIKSLDITKAVEMEVTVCGPPPEEGGIMICALGPPLMALPEILPPKKINQDVNPIPGVLRPGMCVYFKGTVPIECYRFSINLYCGHKDGSDNAFHFNPRFDSNLVVFNTCRNGNWENEERPDGMPFSKGEDFELLYIITSEGYQVYVNGQTFYLFKHRMEVEDVTAIKFVGDVAIETTNITEGGQGGMQGRLTLGRIVVPSVPFMTTIHGGLKVGMQLHFKGTVNNRIQRFAINLQSGQKKGLKALHFNPRFSPPVVVFNTFKRGWQREERVHEMPFQKGEDFEILFIVNARGYQVNVNGRLFYTFKHRIPAETVNVIKIAGGVSMESIDITGGAQEATQGLLKMSVAKIPYVGPLAGGLSTGMYMYFRGTVPQKIRRFHINLQCGQMRRCDKALHFNPRFQPSEVVVFNTFRNCRWENEERVNKMPFSRGENFELLFIITAQGYQVVINGRQFYLFKHRIAMEQVNGLKIAGDVSMKTVKMIKGVPGALTSHPKLGKMVITKIPHVGPIFGGLRIGMALFFRGTVPQEINRFHINLQSGHMKGSDKALHFNPRFDGTEVVVFNTFRNGRWENEERPETMPFSKGEDFELVFLVTAEGYQVNVNGRQFYLFKHRMPVEHVNAIKIAGDVSMESVNMTEVGKVGLLRHPGLGKMVVSSIPFVGPIQGCLRTGIYMYFRGTVPEDIDRFAINLQYGEKKGCDKALHFNPRFKPSEVIVFNSFQNSSWKREERVHQMPFRKGEEFEMVIIVTTVGYQVIVNGRPLYMFKHRLPVEQVSAIKIAGDVSMQTVNLTGGAQGSQDKMAIPQIPHLAPVYGGLRTGMFLFFRGTVPQEINRFHINLQYGQLKGSDKALHFNPRFTPNPVVVFNTFRNGKWEKEERVHEMPFTKGEDFQLAFVVTPKGYQVMVNGRLFYLFKHRMALEHVSAIKIAGDVSMQTVRMIGGDDDDDDKGRPDVGRLAITKIPHVGPIHRGLRLGRALHFRGTIPEDINRFAINLQYGKRDGSDIALHFNPRFTPYEVVVFNTFRKGRWEKEERPGQMPFSKGEDFHLVFFITAVGYQVYVNGIKFHMFKHRMPLENVNAIKIAGDVSMENADMTNEVPEEDIPDTKELVTGDDLMICPFPLPKKELETCPAPKEMLSVPYLKPISDPLKPGMAVLVKGHVPSDCYRFSINLFCGEEEDSDIALHFNPRFDSNLVVFNTRQGNWENEERPSEMPFRKGEDFKTVIIITSDGFQINVNGREFYLFKHRIELEKVKALKILPDVTLYRVSISKGVKEIPALKEDLSVPYLKPISDPLKPGMAVLVKGHVPSDCYRFSINLFCGEEDSDIALHFNPRFDSNLVVFNTRQGNWENEERPSEMPFRKGEDFKTVIIITSDGFQINVNGREFYLFKHRIELEKVKALKIVPDVTLHRVSISKGVKEIPALKEDLSVPYLKPISDPLKPGMAVLVKGHVPSDCYRFSINLFCGEEEDSDIALHFNPRFDSNLVVFNTRQGNWENEERPSEMPFRKGEDFKTVIIITSDGFQINVNGCEFYLFKHRIELEKVKALKILPDVTLHRVSISKGVKEIPALKEDLSVPYLKPISDPLKPGMAVLVKGHVPSDCYRFSINLFCGEEEDSDIALHFNPRFDSNLVVFNTRQGNWENEERPSEMPFRKGEDFKTVIIITSDGFQINVNGREFYLFKHRIELEKVKALKIVPDVTLHRVSISKEVKEIPALKEDLSVPYLKPISDPLKPGMAVLVKGHVPSDCYRFSINLFCGEEEDSDIALHFNPRFDSNLVVFNTRQGNWENEERPSEMPFCKGEDFKTVIIITSDGFQINVNGREFYLFKHRIELEKVKALKILPDVTLYRVSISKGVKEIPALKEDLSVPYLKPISDPLKPGMAVLVKGHVPSDCYRFSINLFCGEEEDSDIALHFNPRFDSNLVVFNTRRGNWGKEERPSEMPFHKGEDFKTVIIITSDGFQINVNGREFYLFKHRIELDKVRALKIIPDVTLHRVSISKGDKHIQTRPALKEILKIPHVGPIYGGLRPGMALFFRGKVPQNSKRFSINLCCDGSDNALHLNPRFDSKVVVFNTHQNGHWENEERPSEMPFSRGEDFRIAIIVTPQGYQVKVNGQDFYLFKHRIPMEQVRDIKIYGDVSVQSTNITEGGQEGIKGQLSLGKTVFNTIPYKGTIHGGVRKGMYLYFRGTVHDDINRFHINLQYGEKKGSAKAIHFNPRFKPSQVVVFNTFRNGRWEKEERVHEMPFRQGEDFELVFIVTPKGYQVNVNGRRFYMFKHRMAVEQVNSLAIGGDVSMNSLKVIGGGPGGIQGYQGPRKMLVTKIPHVGPVYGGLRTGMYLYFRGTVPESIKRFHINLQYGQNKGSDKALHFNPRFEPSEVVVFNTFRNGSWENEERPAEMPFRKGEDFEVVFFITAEGYQVNVNGHPFYFFKHRMPVEHVAALQIAGDVSMKTVNMTGGGPGGKQPGLQKMLVTKIPQGPIYGGLRTGMYLYFKGTIPQEIKRFHINLQYGQMKKCDKALHFNPRFEPEEVVVFNSFRNGGWENEERPEEMPFRKGEDFELLFIITSEGYQVNVNGKQFYFFKHRMPVEYVNAVKIAGDVSMETATLTEGGQDAEEIKDKEAMVELPPVKSILGGLRPGMYLYFKGTIPQEIKRFHINLSYGEKKGCDKALHFNPRFDPEEVVVFNSFRNGSWENEERPEGMPFSKGEDFEIFIFVTSEGYQVNVNGRQFHMFKHRMPVDQVSAVKFAGDVSMRTVNTIRKELGAQGQPGLGKVVVSKIPHVGPVYGGLRPGMYLYFKGTVPEDIDRFHINLQCGKMKGCDKALHFNPRFKPEEVVVFNSFRNGSWENEERPAEMPFRKGENFEMVFIITLEGFQVNINGRQFHLFKHRIPVEQVTTVKIAGDVSVKTINTVVRTKGLEVQPGLGKMVISKIPHVQPVYGGMRKGMVLYFRGTIPQNITRFHINLQYGQMKGSDKALHFNPRFDPEEVVVLNAFQNGGWQNEERVNEMPFRKGEDFELLFIITRKGYQINVNGSEFYLFKHRMPVKQVSAIKIVGDVSMKMGKITQGEVEPEEKEIVPSIPRVGPISGLRPGMSLNFRGTIPEDSKTFSINLHCGDKEGCDNAFHFNPRFEPSDVMVFNTFRDGSWENEERVEDMPFQPGDSFELAFIVTSEGYQVNVNDRKFYLFKHRIAMENVTLIRIFGDVAIQCTDIIEGGRLNQGKTMVDSIPFVEHLHHGLRAGMYLYFRGQIDEDINRFHINLQNGDSKGCAKVLHFNPRFQPHEVVVLNTFRNGRWGKEERVNEMPFRKGEDFELVIIVTTKGYQLIVNGRRFYMYKHRMPVGQVSALKIAGDVSMTAINMTEGGIPGSRGLQKMLVPKIPHVAPVYGGLRPGMYLYFRGTIPEEIKRFHINLQYGRNKGSDKALHFNPRFEPEEVVVLNSFRNGRWQKEERPAETPFRKGEDFELVFFITTEGYQVNVNGRQYCFFKHRMPVEQVSAIKITGDVSIKTANMIEGGEGGMNPSLGKMVVTQIPHVGPVYGGLRPGMFVTFRGTVPQEIKRFHINLQYGQMKGCDKALHFNPRFDPEEVMVLNAFHNGGWQNEERPEGMPFTKGEDFELVFMITSEGYQIYVNGRHFYLFKHRIPVDQVSAIKIAGDISMQTVNTIQGGKGAPVLPPPGPVATTPHLEPISGGLRPGMYLYFKGTVPQEAKGFAINLQNGQMKGCDKALHFNPRFDGTEVVVFNSFLNGSWQNEERPEGMPFSKGEEFELVIIVTAEGYQVNVNGRQFYLFKHRMSLETVSAIKIAADVSIQSTNIIEGGPGQPGLGKTVISTIPHVAPVYGGLRPGMYLYFRGTIPEDIKRFHINLQYGEMKGCDKALHFNPRFDPEEVMVLNAFRNGGWENEERPEGMPFTKGEDFELLFFITEEGYQINVNGRQYYLFKHRMPVEHVSAIKIVGEVTMKTLNMIQGGQGVEGSPGLGKIEKIPHVGPIYGGLRPGMALFFQGTVPEELKRFAINLQYAKMNDSDIAFHFNPRFEPSGLVVFNSFRNGSWENEEWVNKNPFKPGQNFVLVFIITEKGYQVVINGRRFYFFKHRMPVEQVSALKITGTVFIQTATMIAEEDVDIEEKPGEEEEKPEEEAEKPDEKEEEKPEGEVEKPEEKPEGEVEKPDEKEEEKPEGEVEKPDEKEEEKPEPLPEEEVISSGDFKPGTAVYFKGTIPNEITSFGVNLRCGDTKDSDIAFNFNTQFEPTEAIVMNSFQNGSWETEERVTTMPFRQGQSFELVFHILSEGYQVYVDRRKIYLFKHRIPVERITTVQIVGEIPMHKADLIDIGQLMPGKPEDDEDDETAQAVPIPRTLVPGLSMSFQGLIPDECNSFSIDLRSGDAEGSDTALHFNPQLDSSEVVFNSFKNGSWEEEEKVTEMPFRKGESFLVVFMIKEDGYQVNVNGCPLYMFKHRMVLEQVRAIKIIGGISIQTINIVEIFTKEIVETVEETIQAEAPLPSALTIGTSVTFDGTVPEDTKGFSINLLCGDAKGSDVAFHFSPQFETSEVVFNTFRNGSWEEAEKVDTMPFTKGEKFELVYIITAEGYQVNINGAEFYLFKHRIAVDQVKIVQIVGDVSVPVINIVEATVQEYTSPAAYGTVQSSVPMPDCFKPWVTLSFQGLVPVDAESFSINLQCGDTDNCDTAFHFRPQLKTSEVVFNSFCNGHWEQEEKVTEMPFRAGENFELTYMITLEGFQVNVNGNLLHVFKHRMAVERVRVLQIIGEVSILAINIIETAPSVTPLPSGLKAGTSMTFLGTIPSESTRFSIDLQCGDVEGCDTAFQFHPQFEPAEGVVMNSFQNSAWETEERVEQMPFQRGQDFELVYTVTEEGYQVKANGQDFYLFKHRIPAEQVKALQISGNVNVPTLNIVEGAPCMETTCFETVITSGPFVVPIPGGFKEGMTVDLTGWVAPDIPSFSIDLQCGEQEGCDTALRINAQFQPAEALVFNSFKDGSWGEEERLDVMPFTWGGKFVLGFFITSEGYQLKVNETELHVFKHRIPVERVSALQIVGNITVENVNILEAPVCVPPSDMGQLEISGCIAGETWTCGAAELERGDGGI